MRVARIASWPTNTHGIVVASPQRVRGNTYLGRTSASIMPAETFTLAAAQVEPVYHDKEATLDRTCEWIERAGREGADLVVFPETYFPGYPYWRGSVSIPRWTDLVVELQKNSFHVEDEAMAGRYELSPADVEAIAAEHEVPIETVEAVVDAVHDL
ncbi:nitrilase-related carbon-nitrogen hydrolase [Halococcus agarilyticus]|uniref:nitrilase-related carbon-nitrogen hydrolase n=1 Tax=Halococcus agarilyticus TaxID=1232219 RepID=UPI000677D49D|nr:nitrilase-related carbon-nitrogen hydrolase [Halococcus agarilyticus]